MTVERQTPLMMGCSLEQLRNKLLNPASPLHPWWRKMLRLARTDPVWYSPYTVLAALVTGEKQDRELAKKAFLRFVELRREGETSLDAQYHTHVTVAPLARWAVYYDWVADLGLFSDEEDAAVREAILDHAYIFALPHALSRAQAYDNQIMSNALCAAVVGYVLGVKRGNNASARWMFGQGLKALERVLGLMPKGGYSLEGSGYYTLVVIPLLSLAGMFYREALGRDVFATGTPPFHTPLVEPFETNWRFIGPNGWLPAWDAGGVLPPMVSSGLAMLARLTGNAEPLKIMREHQMLYRTGLVAWDTDDKLWTLIWWPENLAFDAPARYDDWMDENVAGALQDRKNKLRLLQYWDECGGINFSGRTQVNPNAIQFEAFGSPLLVDGYGAPRAELVPVPVDKVGEYVGGRAIEGLREYINSTWGAPPSVADATRMTMAGCVGLSNSLVFDEEYWYVPREPVSGKGLSIHRIGPLAAITSDAAAYYSSRYDVSRVERTSVLVRGKYVLVTDLVKARSPHAITWQAYIRETGRIEQGRAVIQTPEGTRLQVVPLQNGGFDIFPVPEYPKEPKGGSVLVRHTLAPATVARIDVALLPSTGMSLAEELSEGWHRDSGGTGEAVSLMTAHLTDPCTEPDKPRVFRRNANLAVEPGRRHLLRIAIANRGVALIVNGTEIAPLVDQHDSSSHWHNAPDMPWFFDVSTALRNGDNAFEMRVPYFHGESLCGPVELLVEKPTPMPTVERVGADAFRLKEGEQTDELLAGRETGLAPWAGGETDARHAVLTEDGALAALDVSRLALPSGLAVRSVGPCDIHWTRQATAIGKYVDGDAIDVRWPGAQLLIDLAGCLQVTYWGSANHRVQIHSENPRAVFVNGRPMGTTSGPLDIELQATVDRKPGEAHTVEELHAAVTEAGSNTAESILRALRSEDWRLQMAAADLAGVTGIQAAVPMLLALFDESEKELPYPNLTQWWRWSKMLREPGKLEGYDPSIPLPIGVKRWRVKRAVVSALGKLGDRRAVASLEKALTRCDDFFPVLSVLAVALGRLGAESSKAVIERHVNHGEINLQRQARLALALLKGELDRASFEAQVVG